MYIGNIAPNLDEPYIPSHEERMERDLEDIYNLLKTIDVDQMVRLGLIKDGGNVSLARAIAIYYRERITETT